MSPDLNAIALYLRWLIHGPNDGSAVDTIRGRGRAIWKQCHGPLF